MTTYHVVDPHSRITEYRSWTAAARAIGVTATPRPRAMTRPGDDGAHELLVSHPAAGTYRVVRVDD